MLKCKFDAPLRKLMLLLCRRFYTYLCMRACICACMQLCMRIDVCVPVCVGVLYVVVCISVATCVAVKRAKLMQLLWWMAGGHERTGCTVLRHVYLAFCCQVLVQGCTLLSQPLLCAERLKAEVDKKDKQSVAAASALACKVCCSPTLLSPAHV